MEEVFAGQELVQQNRALAGWLTEAAKLETYETGQQVFIEGQPGRNKLYFVLCGSFDLLIKGSPIRILRSGQAVGEFPILNPSLPHTVTIRAREPSGMATVREAEFLLVANRYPDLWRNMAKMLVARLHSTYERVPVPKDPCVFIGHGHDVLWTLVRQFLENKCGLEVISFESEPHAGESIVPVLESMLAKATFAVLVLTGEDKTIRGSKRARQNVVHEAGLFQGVLGFPRAILLVQKGLEEFSNVHGLQCISFEGAQIASTFPELRRVLRREKQIS